MIPAPLRDRLIRWENCFSATLLRFKDDDLERREAQIASGGRLLNEPATDASIEALRMRLGSIHPEIAELLRVADGLTIPFFETGSVEVLSSAEIDWYSSVLPKSFASWLKVATKCGEDLGNESDAEGTEFVVPSVEMLRTAIALSRERGGASLIACSSVGRWAFCRLSAHGKSVAFESLSDLLECEFSRSATAISRALDD